MPDRTINYTARFKGEAEEVDVIDDTFHRIWNALGCDKNEAIRQIYQEGMAAVAAKLSAKGELSNEWYAVFAKLHEIRAANVKRANLERLYSSMNVDDFLEFCKANEIDGQAFLDDNKFSITQPHASRSQMSQWLDKTLADGELMDIAEIRDRAELEKIVSNDEDWKTMKVIASQRGYSGNDHRGQWKRK